MLQFFKENSIFFVGSLLLAGLFMGSSYLQKPSGKNISSITGQNPILEETNITTPPILNVLNPIVDKNVITTVEKKSILKSTPKTKSTPKKIIRPLRSGDDEFEREFEDH